MDILAELRTTFVLFALLASLVPAVAAAGSEPSGDYVIGFYAMPEEARAGTYASERVERVDEALGFAVVQARNARGLEERAAHDPNVRYVQREVYATAEATPNDPFYVYQTGWGRVNAPAAWDQTMGSSSVVVAVIDTGIDRAHPDLQGARFLQGYDFMNGDATPNDDCGHGTAVAGIVGATTGNGVGVAGGAQVTVMPLKALGLTSTGSCSGPFSAVASSIRYAADNGARVISMSLGARGVFDQPTSDAIEYAWSKGVVLVASAGNAGPCTNCVSWPAAHPRVVAVAATDTYNAQATFSSAGPEVDIAAPGKNIYTTTLGGGYNPMSGTSAAAPHVSAALALAASANGAVTNDQLRSMLTSTAKDLGTAGFDTIFGAGLVDFNGLVSAAKGAAPAPAPAPAPNAAPTASFTATPSGLTVNVDASASTDAEGPIADYAWTWGDGLGFSSGDCATAAHQYAAAGTYTLTLTVRDAAGATASTTRTVTLSAPAPAPAPNAAPTASFTTSTSGLTASANGAGSTDSDGTIVSWAWAWGDGATSTGTSASHAYAAAGTYTVSLTVTDDKGATGTTTSSVTVTAPAPVTPKAHVGDITGTVKRMGSGERLTWSVLVLDASGAIVPGASVKATVNGPSGTTTLYATTSTTGVATFRVDAPKTAGLTYTLTVAGVTLSGWTYDAAANTVSSRSLTTV